VTRLRLRDDAVRWREIEQEIVAVDLGRSDYVSTNESGVLLWRRLAVGTTRQQLVEELVSAFGIDRGRASEDVGRFLDELDARNLLERA
jgi:hypothetical protein